MKRKEIQTMLAQDTIALQKEVRQIREKINSIKINRFTKPVKNVKEVKHLRNKLALILTSMRQKELNNG
jgi:hypothetical protein